MNISFFQNGQTMRAINTFKALPGNSFFHKARTNINTFCFAIESRNLCL